MVSIAKHFRGLSVIAIMCTALCDPYFAVGDLIDQSIFFVDMTAPIPGQPF